MQAVAAPKKITPQQRRQLAAEAQVTPRTVARWLKGLPMKPTVKERVERAWQALRAE